MISTAYNNSHSPNSHLPSNIICKNHRRHGTASEHCKVLHYTVTSLSIQEHDLQTLKMQIRFLEGGTLSALYLGTSVITTIPGLVGGRVWLGKVSDSMGLEA